MRIDFETCQLEWQPEHRRAVVTFPDGAETPACPHDDDQYRGHAERSGVGQDVDQYCLDHELAHCWFGKYACDGESPVLRSVADNTPINQVQSDLEEEITKLIQRYFNKFGWPQEMKETRKWR